MIKFRGHQSPPFQSGNFQVPLKLYGRERELDTLLKAFGKIKQGEKQMILVTGPVGNGKSALVHEFHKAVLKKKGYFATGKFDQLQENLPFQSMFQAFRSLIRQMLGESEGRLATWKKILLKALGSNSRVIIEVIPELELITGPSLPISELPKAASQKRLIQVFQDFLGALCTLEHPVTFFLDDLQWSDSSSLEMLKQLMSTSKVQGFLVIGAYHKEDTEHQEVLLPTLEHLKNSGTTFYQFQIKPLSLEVVNQIASQTFRCPPEKSLEIAKISYEQTQGNPSFLRQYLHSLYAEGWVEFDQTTQSWEWQIEDILQANQLKKLILEGKSSEVIEVTRSALAKFGVEVPFSEGDAFQFIEKEMEDFSNYLAGRTIAKLASETRRSNQHQVRLMSLLGNLSISAFNQAKNQLNAWADLKGAALCLRHGHSEIAPFNYIAYAFSVLLDLLKDYESAYEYGKMAVALSEKYNNLSYQGRTYFRFAVTISPLKNPISESLGFLRRAITLCRESRDFSFSACSMGMLSIFQIIGGVELPKIRQELEKHILHIKINAPTYYEWALKPLVLEVLDTYTGKKTLQVEPTPLSNPQNPLHLAFYYCSKIRSLTLFGKHEDALKFLDKAERFARSRLETVIIAETYFYLCLSLAAVLSDFPDPKTENLYHSTIDKYQEEMKNWVEHSPSNFEHKYLLVEAEKARISDNATMAMEYYRQGISSAKEHGYFNIEALGNELYAQFWLKMEQGEFAKIYLLHALRLYQRWGALGKVKQLVQKHPQLIGLPQLSGGSPSPSETIPKKLNLDAIVNASQTLSEEIQQEKLLTRLLRIIIDHAGAGRGMLLLKKQSSLLIEGTFDTSIQPKQPDAEGEVEILIQQHVPEEWHLPQSVARFVMRTGETVRIDEASEWQDFSNDFYFSYKSPQSILCIPLKKKERVDGILYLENDITSGVFTEEQVQMLEILLSQATISLENARLYDHLEDQVEERTKALQDTLTQLKETHHDLSLAKADAEAANHSKSTFLANMSHEIRTPMNAILGFAEVLERRITSTKHLKFLHSIRSSGKSLLTLINDILDLSKIEAGKLELEYTAFLPQTLFQEMGMIFSHQMQEKGLEFYLDMEPTQREAIYLDEIRLRQILINLMGNAVKFTQQGSIKISFSMKEIANDPSKRDLSFSVLDTGIGIQVDQLQSIFGAFEQQKGQNQVQFGGTGLGLSISKRLVEMMGGKIWATSTVGEGSHFQVILEGVPIIVHSEKDERMRQNSKEETLHFDSASILIVDDLDNNRKLVREFLSPYNFHFHEATNGKEALDLIQEVQPDLILMDHKMPVLSGFEATQILKADKKWNQIPVIALTASVMKEEEEKFRELFDGYLRKPVTQTQLTHEIARFLPHRTKNRHHPQTDFNEKRAAHEEDQAPPAETTCNFSKLHQCLEAETQTWKRISQALSTRDIKGFAQHCMELGNTHNYAPLIQWAEKLYGQAEQFELEALPETLEYFPKIVKSLEMHL